MEFLINAQGHLKERENIAPFFKYRLNLCAALGLTNGHIVLPDRVASELALFGDFVCDAASGDSQTNAYTLVEFEDAGPNSIFAPLEKGKTVARWSSRFERGHSQLIDWAWRLSTEGASPAYRRIFGDDQCSIHMLLVVGRSASLTKDDVKRLQWRSANIALGQFRISCQTFDDVIVSVRRRLALADQGL